MKAHISGQSIFSCPVELVGANVFWDLFPHHFELARHSLSMPKFVTHLGLELALALHGEILVPEHVDLYGTM